MRQCLQSLGPGKGLPPQVFPAGSCKQEVLRCPGSLTLKLHLPSLSCSSLGIGSGVRYCSVGFLTADVRTIFSLSGCYQFFASHWHYYSEILPHNQLGHSKIYILFHYAIGERREAGAVLRYDARRRKGQEICDLQIHIFHTQAGFLHLVFY
jgi:hypothetical protein